MTIVTLQMGALDPSTHEKDPNRYKNDNDPNNIQLPYIIRQHDKIRLLEKQLSQYEQNYVSAHDHAQQNMSDELKKIDHQRQQLQQLRDSLIEHAQHLNGKRIDFGLDNVPQELEKLYHHTCMLCKRAHQCVAMFRMYKHIKPSIR